MNDQQRIGFENLLAEAQRRAAAIDAQVKPTMAAVLLLNRALARALAGGPGRLEAVARWADEIGDAVGCPDDHTRALNSLRDDAQALARWIEGRL